MRKLYALLTAVFFSLTLNAQVSDSLRSVDSVSIKGTSGHVAPNGTCDTLNLYTANNWQAFYYKYYGGGSPLGVCNLETPSKLRIIETANFYDASSSNYNYITGGLVYFAFANATDPTHLARHVYFKLYDAAGPGGEPGNLLDSTGLTLEEIHQDVLAGKMTEFKFKAPVQLPASKKFYISIDVRSFAWGPVIKDTVVLVSTANGATQPNTFEYFLSDSVPLYWMAVDSFFAYNNKSLNVTLFTFPYVISTLDACSLLPVSIFNFGGAIKNYEAYLNWSTAMESNNKGFYVERSKDGRDFTDIGFVAGAGNSTQIKNYSFVDAGLKDIGVNTTYYRLKQVDNDGQFNYSQVLALNLQNNTSKLRLYPNPAIDIATVETNLDVASKVHVRVVSDNGTVVQDLDKGVLNPGLQQIYISTSNLAKGSYIIQLTVGNDHYSQIMVKQ
jgi:hypothetical protein